MVDVERDPPVHRLSGSTPAPTWQGDLNLHERPYTQTAPQGMGDLFGADHALWQDSSGYGNLLGHLEFANTVQGGDQFAAPN
jgi:hypothetical protein